MKKIKIHKESVKAILSTEWWLFLLIPLLVSGTFFYVFYLSDKPKDNEQIRIFSGFSMTEQFNTKIHENYKDNFKDYGIIDTKTYWLDEGSTTYALSFGDSTFVNYEIIISSLDEYNLSPGLYNTNVASLDKNYFSSELEFLYFEDKPIAIKVYDANNSEYNDKFTFKTNLNFSKTAYAFASSKSVNYQTKVDDTHSLNEYALKVFTSFCD